MAKTVEGLDAGVETSSVERAARRDKTVRLSEAQTIVLVRGSQTPEGTLLPPEVTGGIGSNGNADAYGSSPNERRSINAMLRKGLLEGDADDPQSLRLTALAFEALHIDPVEWPERLRDQGCGDADTAAFDAVARTIKRHLEAEQKPEPKLDQASPIGSQGTRALRPGSKGARLLDLLSTNVGVTLQALQEASGWHAHSVRGFLSGTIRKKLGHELIRDKTDDGIPTWRIVGPEEATS